MYPPSFIDYYPSIYLENVDVVSGSETNRTATFNYGTLNVHSRDFDGNPLDSYVYVYNQSTGSGITSGSTGSDGVVSFELAPDIYKVMVRKSTDVWYYNVVVLGGEVTNIGDYVNHDPVISSITASPARINPGGSSTVTVSASDSDMDTLSYSYSASVGTVVGSGSTAVYTAPDTMDTYRIDVVVSDGNGGTDQGCIFVSDRYGDLVVNSRGANGELLDSQVYVYKQSTGAYAGSGWAGSDGTITFSLLEDIYKIMVRESNDIWVENVLVVYGSTGIIIGDDINNTAPVIDLYSPTQTSLTIDECGNITFTANVSDSDGTNPQYRWNLDGVFQSALPTWTFYASYTDGGDRTVTLEVTDGQYSVYQTWHVTVNNVNRNPIITSFYADNLTVGTSDSVNISVMAIDLDEDSLTYSWDATGGTILPYSNSSISWIAPTIEGFYTVSLTISDNDGGIVEDSAVIMVTNDEPDSTVTGDLNSDGTLTPADAAIALQLAASGGWDPAADVNHDSRVTSLDALMILQAAGGKMEAR